MRRLSLCAAVLALAALAWPARSDDAASATSLFDGKTLDGWVQRGGKAKYSVEDGCIVGRSVADSGGNSFLCTKKDYSDFVLELEFKVDPRLNSGVQVRSQCFEEAKELPFKNDKGKAIKVPAGRVHGYQVEIDPSERAWTGGIYDESRRGWLKDLKENEPARKAFKQNEWNKFRIECKGPSIKTWLNGVAAADLKDNATPKGFIALQVHAVDPKKITDTLEVRWRAIRLNELK